MPDDKPVVLITGVAGDVGDAIVSALGDVYAIVGMDQGGKAASVPIIDADLTADASVVQAFEEFQNQHGGHIASVIHLAGYFDFTGKDDPLYHSLNVDGTRRVMEQLKRFRVEQFIYAGTMLVHEAVKPGEHFDESRELEPRWIYPRSKVEAEAVIRAEHGVTPYLLFHLGGLYDEKTVVPTLAHQIARIWERDLESHVYPGDLKTGQSMVHKADMADAFRRAVDRRAALPPETVVLIGEPDPPGYGELQDALGELIHGTDWTTLRVPAPLAAAGAWLQDEVAPHIPKQLGGGHEPFVRPFMAMEASDHYALDIGRAEALLDWRPHRRLIDVLPKIVEGLKADPKAWFKANGLAWGPSDSGN